MIDLKKILDEALTIPATDKSSELELKVRKELKEKYKDFYGDTIIKCLRNDEKSGQKSAKELAQTYLIGLGNIIDLLKVYEKCKKKYLTQKQDKKIELELPSGKKFLRHPVEDFNMLGKLDVLKQFIDKLEKMVNGEEAIPTDFKKYAVTEADRQNMRVLGFNDEMMVWGTRDFYTSQKFAVQLWQNIETIDSSAAYGEPDKQCPYCTHCKSHWDSYSDGDEEYEQYWFLWIPKGVAAGDLELGYLSEHPKLAKVFNAMKGLGPKILCGQCDSNGDWCDYEDNPLTESDYSIMDEEAEEGWFEDNRDEDSEWGAEEDEEGFYWNGGLDDIRELFKKSFAEDRFDLEKLHMKKMGWESDTQFKRRREQYIKQHSLGTSGIVLPASEFPEEKKRGEIVVDFDVENDVWKDDIYLTQKDFEHGKLITKLPKRVARAVMIGDSYGYEMKGKLLKIDSFEGFPEQYDCRGGNFCIRFRGCDIKSFETFPKVSGFKGRWLQFYGCQFGKFDIENLIQGNEISNLEIEDIQGRLDLSHLSGVKTKKLKLEGAFRNNSREDQAEVDFSGCSSSVDGLEGVVASRLTSAKCKEGFFRGVKRMVLENMSPDTAANLVSGIGDVEELQIKFADSFSSGYALTNDALKTILNSCGEGSAVTLKNFTVSQDDYVSLLDGCKFLKNAELEPKSFSGFGISQRQLAQQKAVKKFEEIIYLYKKHSEEAFKSGVFDHSETAYFKHQKSGDIFKYRSSGLWSKEEEALLKDGKLYPLSMGVVTSKRASGKFQLLTPNSGQKILSALLVSGETFGKFIDLDFTKFDCGLEEVTKIPQETETLRVGGKALKRVSGLQLKTLEINSFSDHPKEILVENCRAKWTSVEASGEGSTEGVKIIFRGCEFSSVSLRPLFIEGSSLQVRFENCKIGPSMTSEESLHFTGSHVVEVVNSSIDSSYWILKGARFSFSNSTVHTSSFSAAADRKTDYSSVKIFADKVSIGSEGEDGSQISEILAALSPNGDSMKELSIGASHTKSLHFLDGLKFSVDKLDLSGYDLEDVVFTPQNGVEIKKMTLHHEYSKFKTLNGLFVRGVKELRVVDHKNPFKDELEKAFQLAPTSSEAYVAKPEFIDDTGHIDLNQDKIHESQQAAEWNRILKLFN